MQTNVDDGRPYVSYLDLCLRMCTLLMVSLTIAGVTRTTAAAQAVEERIVSDPPLLRGESAQLKQLAPALDSSRVEQSETSLDLNVVYTDGKIWNPAAGRYDKVRLRSYQGRQIDPNRPFVSPSIVVSPGETLRITLNNKLPSETTCTEHVHDVNEPHCANGTNLHTHGLWVNPAGNSDNVLLSVNPGVSFTYEYHIPSDHPAGTFWYHTHKHGSTALQVSSGMAGALVVRGNRLPSAGMPGDLDTLLRPIPGQRFRERIVLFQQIQYACRDAQGLVKDDANGVYLCDPNDVGGIELGPVTKYDQFGIDPVTGASNWSRSGRYTSINGQVLPTFADARAGSIERWRMIHGGVRDSLNVQFRKLKRGAALPTALRAADNDAFVSDNCTGEPLPQHLVAADGLTAAAALKTDTTVFQPAYRWDALLVFPEPGVYCVVDAAAPASATVSRRTPSRGLLGWVRVAPGVPVSGDVSAYLATQLARAATLHMPAAVRGTVIADLKDGLKLRSFMAHPERIEDSEISGTRQVVFNIRPPVNTDPSNKPVEFLVNNAPFDPERVDHVLKLGATEEWTLKSDFVNHPFHIHVNPFQIVKILDPSGRDVSGPDAVDTTGQSIDPQYRGLKGMWKDTIMLKNTGAPYTIVVRSRYKRYIGDFVLHCHILDHEDQGMMQLVRVALSDGAGGISHGHQPGPKPRTAAAGINQRGPKPRTAAPTAPAASSVSAAKR